MNHQTVHSTLNKYQQLESRMAKCLFIVFAVSVAVVISLVQSVPVKRSCNSHDPIANLKTALTLTREASVSYIVMIDIYLIMFYMLAEYIKHREQLVGVGETKIGC